MGFCMAGRPQDTRGNKGSLFIFGVTTLAVVGTLLYGLNSRNDSPVSQSTTQRVEKDIAEVVGVPRGVHYGPTHSGGFLSVVTGAQGSSETYTFFDRNLKKDFGKIAALIDAEIRDGDEEPITLRYRPSSNELVGVFAYGTNLDKRE